MVQYNGAIGEPCGPPLRWAPLSLERRPARARRCAPRPPTAVGAPPRDQCPPRTGRDTWEVRRALPLHAPPGTGGQVVPHRHGGGLGLPLRPVPTGAGVTSGRKAGRQDERPGRRHHARVPRRPPEGSRAAVRLRQCAHPHGRARGAGRAQRCLPLLAPRLSLPGVEPHGDRQASDPRRPLVRLPLPPGFPEDGRAPALGIATVKPLLLGLLGGAGEGARRCPAWGCSVRSREASGPPTLLCAPVTAGGRLPSRPVSRALPPLLGAPRRSCLGDNACGPAGDALVPRGHLGPGQTARPATGNMPRGQPLPPRHPSRGAYVPASPPPVSLPRATIRSAGACP